MTRAGRFALIRNSRPATNREMRVADQDSGFVRGRHFTEWVDSIRKLRRSGLDDEAAEILFECVEATEAEAAAMQFGVAPWYYEQLAIILRGRGDLAAEIQILERYANQPHAPGVKPPRLLDRLRKARLR